MAVLGTALTAPEVGWKRIEEDDSNISYTGTWTTQTAGNVSVTSLKETNVSNNTFRFNFSGTKLRIIGIRNTDRASAVKVYIDAILYTFTTNGSRLDDCLLFEKTGLPQGKHSVLVDVGTLSSGIYFGYSSIDIDESGVMSPYSTAIGTALTAPEAGWKRYDDSDSAIKYGGGWGKVSATGAYKGAFTTNSGTGTSSRITFKTTCSKLRIIGRTATNGDELANISVDGVIYTFSNYTTSNIEQVLLFEKIFDDSSERIIEIWTPNVKAVNLDAIDIDSTGRLFHPDEVTEPKDLTVGKRIRCNYKSATANTVGTFSGLGQETKDFIPVASSATPDGDFYYIMVEDWNGTKKLIADRNIQSGISWDTLNTAGIASGSGVPNQYTGNVIPTMTSNTAPNGIASASGIVNTTYDAWKAFNNNVADAWQCNAVLGYISYKFEQAKKIKKYGITYVPTSITGPNRAPKDWTFEGSNDAVIWTVLDRQTNQTAWGSGEKRTYSMDNIKSPFLHYRLNISANNGDASYLAIAEIEMMESFFDAESFSFTTRLLTGGIASTDKDNEWDKYIVGSTLGGTITAGDNNVWNWSGVYSWISTTPATNTQRVIRGSGANNTLTSTTSSATNSGFRPVLLIESIFITLNKSFILFNGEYKKFVQGTPETYKNEVPIMTSDNIPSGLVTASSYASTSYGWRAFDGDSSTNWSANGITGWIVYSFLTQKSIKRYFIQGHSSIPARTPKSWVLYGSNDGSTWVKIDERTSESAWTNGQKREYVLSKNETYSQFKLDIIANNGDASYTQIAEIGYISESPATPSLWQTVSATLPSLDTFKSEGMDDLSVFDRKATKITKAMTSEVLGSGKVMKSKVDVNKYFDLNSINVK